MFAKAEKERPNIGFCKGDMNGIIMAISAIYLQPFPFILDFKNSKGNRSERNSIYFLCLTFNLNNL